MTESRNKFLSNNCFVFHPQPPRRVQNWYSTWQALDFRPGCPQNLKYVGASNGIRNGVHEDCLYLNIYTPTVSSRPLRVAQILRGIISSGYLPMLCIVLEESKYGRIFTYAPEEHVGFCL